MELFGICVIQYQQNFFPGSGFTGSGSARRKPSANIKPPAIEIGRPNTETPKGTYQSVTTRNAPKMARIAPDAISPLYI